MAVDDGFEDRYGAVAASYARHRPAYPRGLFDLVASAAPARRRCWDAGTGSGQAAVVLASYFREIVATDASQQQLDQAVAAPGVEYRCEPSESTSIPDRSVDAITVASAIHWFERPAFFDEVRRVGAPGALLAVWTYTTALEVDPGVDRVVRHISAQLLGPMWTSHIRTLEGGLGRLALPFHDLPVPSFSIEQSWTLAELCGYIQTWSAAVSYERARGRPVTDEVHDALATAWGDPDRRRVVRLPLQVRMGIVRPGDGS